MTETLKPLMTTGELAKYLGISKAHLNRLRCIDSGPPYIKLGDGRVGCVRYRREDVLKYIESRLCTGSNND